MKIPPVYKITPEILELLAKIEANRFYFLTNPLPKPLKDNLQRQSLLKSSIYSAKIEGNPLDLENYESGEAKRKKEIFNILSAIKLIEKTVKKSSLITQKLILKLHQVIMKDLSVGGHFRSEVGAIFNQAGVPVYISPPPTEINDLINKLLSYVNSVKEKFPLVNAFISHLIFEKIHPFIDGNGRVGRLLVLAILKAKGVDFGIHIPFEEYLNEHRKDYYYFLDKGLLKTNDYLSFMLLAFFEESERIKKLIAQKVIVKKPPLLPPRQEEIYQIINDHPLIPFDSIRRRFLKVPERTLRYDLKKLLEKKLIIKIGKTKGSYYRVK